MQSSFSVKAVAHTVTPSAVQQGSKFLTAVVHWIDRWQWELTLGLFALCGIIFLQTVWQVRREERAKENNPQTKAERWAERHRDSEEIKLNSHLRRVAR